MSRVKRIPDRRFRRRAAVAGAIVAMVLAGATVTVLHLSGVDPATASSTGRVTAGPAAVTPAAGPDVSASRTRLEVVLLGAGGVLRDAVDKAPPEQLAELQAAMDAGRVALAGADDAAVATARDSLGAAQAAVEASASAWSTEHARVVAEAENQRQAAQAEAAAAAAKTAAAGTPKPITVPAPVAVLAPPSAAPAPTDPLTAGRDSAAWFTAHLEAIGATGFTISSDWAVCAQPDAGPRYIQGCARSDQPSVIFMKPVDPDLASTEVGRGVVMHEWSHLLQYRLGYASGTPRSDRPQTPSTA